MRTLFAIVMTVAQVAGPWLCCCGPSRALAADPVVSASAPAPQDDAAVCPHCAKRTAAQPAVAPADSKPEPAGPMVPGRCPCCAVNLLDATASEPTRDVDSVLSEFALLTAVPPAFTATVVVPVVIASPAGVSDLPFLTADARLHVHHALRC